MRSTPTRTSDRPGPREVTIDVTRLAARLLEGRHPTGVDRVSLAYIEHFGASARALVRHWRRWVQLGGGGSAALFSALRGSAAHPKPGVRAAVAAGYALRWSKRRGALLLNTGHSGLDAPGYAGAVRALGLRPVYFLHDLIPLTHPEYCRPGEADRHRQRLRTMLATGEGLIVNSQATAACLRGYVRAEGIALPPCVVAPLGTAALPAAAAVPPIAGPYFVMLGTVEPRKNHLLPLHLWRRFAEEGVTPLPKLVIVGQRGWECEQVIDLLERCEALRGHVIEAGACPDAELSNWLAHACALLFPSFAEGYGMPLAEALAAGLPVIASDLPVFREVAGGIPDYLDPLDGTGWRRAVLDYARNDSAARAAQLARMRGFCAPSWERHFEIVDAFLASVAGGDGGFS